MKKNPIIALVLSIIFPGLAHFYVRRFERGLLIMAAMTGSGTFAASMEVIASSEGLNILEWMLSPENFLRIGVEAFDIIWISIILVVVYIWQIIDAYRIAKEL